MIPSSIRQQFVWKTTPVAPRAQPVSPEEWEKHKGTICELYKSTTLDEVMRFMETNHGFSPSRKQYVLQLGKWGLRKYGKEPLPSGIVRGTPGEVSMPRKASGESVGPPVCPLPESQPAKRRKLGYPAPHGTRGSNWNISHDDVSSSRSTSVSSTSGSDQGYPLPNPTCAQSEGPCCNSSKWIFPTSLLSSTPSRGFPHTKIEVEIEQVELAAEFFLHSRCYEDSFRLYTLLLNWARNHGAPLCQFAFKLFKRVEIGRARSGVFNPENPGAGRLSGWADEAGDNAAVQFYRRFSLWESHRRRVGGVLQTYDAAIRDSQTDYFRQVFLKAKTVTRIWDADDSCSRLGAVESFAHSSSMEMLIHCLRWLLGRTSRPSLASHMLAEAYPSGPNEYWRRVLFTSIFCSFWGEFRDDIKRNNTPGWAQMMDISTGISTTELLAVVASLVLQHAPSPSRTSGLLNGILCSDAAIDLVIEGLLETRNEQLAERFFRAFVDPARLRRGRSACHNVWDDVSMRLSRATVLKHLELEPVSFLDLISEGAPAHEDSDAQLPDDFDWDRPVAPHISPAPESTSSEPEGFEVETNDDMILTTSPIAGPIGVPGRTTGPQLPPLTDSLQSPDFESMAALRDHITATVDLQSTMSKLSIDLPSAAPGKASWNSIKSSASQGLRGILGYGVFSGANSPASRFGGSASASLASVLSGASR